MRTVYFLFLLVSFFAEAHYEDWFSEGILSISANNCEKGKSISKVFFSTEKTSFFYNNSSLAEKIDSRISLSPSTQLRFGVTPRVDLELLARGFVQINNTDSSIRVADTSIRIGIQIFRPKISINHSSMRFVVQQDFPTGHFKNLIPEKKGISVSGLGYYKTMFYLCYHATSLVGKKLMRLTLNGGPGFSPPSCRMENFNLYGGGYGTNGHLKGLFHFQVIGNAIYTLTQQVCLAFDLSYLYSSCAKFYGKEGFLAPNVRAITHRPILELLTLAPGFQINFSKQLSLNLSAWFSATGKNTAQFNGGVLEIIYKT